MKLRLTSSDLPDGWNSRPLKRLLREPLKYGANESGGLSDPSCPRYIRITDFGSDGKLRQDTFASLPSEVAEDYLIDKGDLLFARSGATVGKCYYYDGTAGPACFAGYLVKASTRVTKLNSRFLYHFTNSPQYSGWRDSSFVQATIENIGARRYGYLPVPLPTILEQNRIAAYLDVSCAAIDRAVDKKQKQLETLDDLRKSIIHRAITRGLNPRVKLKDSGVSWLGQVPSHWTVARIKRHTSMIRGKFTHRPRNDPAFYDGPYPFFQTGSIARANKYITEYHQTLNEQGLAVSRLFPRGIIVMSIAANIGDVAITDFEGCFPDSIVGFIPDPQTDANFLYYLLKSMKPIMLRSAILTTQLNLNYIRIGANFCAYPPKREQEEIGVYLDQKMDESQKLSFNISEQISTLVDYRKSLIHECVTGKRRITETDIEKVEAYV